MEGARRDALRRLLRLALPFILLLDLLVGAYAVGRAGDEVRDGAGYVTTSINVAYSIGATLILLALLAFTPIPADLRHMIRWYGLVAILVHSVGLLGGLYAAFWWYDDMLHTSLAGMAAFLLVRFAQAIRIFPPSESTPLRAGVLAITAALASAALWEIFEYVVGLMQGTRLQADLDDTMLDMIDGGFGGIVAAAWLFGHPTRHSHPGERSAEPMAKKGSGPSVGRT